MISYFKILNLKSNIKYNKLSNSCVGSGYFLSVLRKKMFWVQAKKYGYVSRPSDAESCD